MDPVKRITNDAVRKIGISIVLFMHDIDTWIRDLIPDQESLPSKMWRMLAAAAALLAAVSSLSVVSDDWRPRERGVRGTRARQPSSRLKLYGETRPRQYGALVCPCASAVLSIYLSRKVELDAMQLSYIFRCFSKVGKT